MSIANVMAGIARVGSIEGIEDDRCNPVPMGIAGYLETYYSNRTRITKLLGPSVAEATKLLEVKLAGTLSLQVILCLPKERPGLDEAAVSELESQLREMALRSNFKISISIIREDHSGGLLALEKLVKTLEETEEEFFLISGVDSFIDGDTAKWLERNGELKCSTNPEGYTPGEAAASILLCRERTAATYDLEIKAKLLAIASATERSLPGSEVPTTGIGLSTAIKEVLQHLPEGEQVCGSYCTLKGLRYESEEHAYSNIVAGPSLKKPGEYASLATSWGDVGAASAPALICYASEKQQQGFGEGDYHLIFTLSPGGSRAAALIQTAGFEES
jgi:3-oxoacyl-[acyl-carrier-protein] synthase-1